MVSFQFLFIYLSFPLVFPNLYIHTYFFIQYKVYPLFIALLNPYRYKMQDRLYSFHAKHKCIYARKENKNRLRVTKYYI